MPSKRASNCWTAASARVAEKKNGQWTVNQWLKKAVLLYFRTHENAIFDAGYTRFFDKVPLKYAARSQADDGAACAKAAHAWCRTQLFAAARTSRPTWCSCPVT